MTELKSVEVNYDSKLIKDHIPISGTAQKRY